MSGPGLVPAHLKARLRALDRSTPPLEVGIVGTAPDPRASLGAAAAAGLDFVVLDLFGPDRDPETDDVALGEPALPTQVWGQRVVGRGDPRGGFEAALGWARHAGLSAVILPLEVGDPAVILRLARALAGRPSPGPAAWVEVPWSAAGLAAFERLAALVGHDPEVSPCVRAQRRAPAAAVIEAWRRAAPACLAVGEPLGGGKVQAALTTLFSGRTQRVYLDGLAPQVVRPALEAAFADARVEGAPPIPDHLDGLIDPVQPLRDHVGAAIYRRFEEVAPKYEAYRRAIGRALDARRAQLNLRVAVLGAGRGPLVDAALGASEDVGVAVKVTAVEKNPQAAITLRQRARGEWRGRVSVEEADIRALGGQRRYDLVVSELLGGFGDNELSPECLAPVSRLLRPGGASVPASSQSYLAPVQCGFLWNAARRFAGGLDAPAGAPLDRAHPLAEYAPCFRFEHSPPDPQDDLRRAVTLSWAARADGVVHGFAGTFAAALDAKQCFGNWPGADVDVLEGWAPLFFPLRQPVRVRAKETVRLAMWRERDAHRVWYAWALLDPVPGPIQNAGGHAAALSA